MVFNRGKESIAEKFSNHMLGSIMRAKAEEEILDDFLFERNISLDEQRNSEGFFSIQNKRNSVKANLSTSYNSSEDLKLIKERIMEPY